MNLGNSTKILILVSAMFCLGLLLGCENTFEPSGLNHIEIDPPEPPEATISVMTSDPTETYYITEPTSVSFTIDVPGLSVYETRVQIHDQLLFNEEVAYGSFVVDPNNLPDGNHILRFESITNSGSGSLAEHLEMEGFNFHYEVPVASTGDEPLESFSFAGAGPDSGGLRVFWDRSQRINFEEYVIRSNHEIYRTIAIDDPSFIDNYYIGGSMEYSMRVRIADQLFSPRSFYHYTPAPAVTSFEQLPDQTLRIHWSQCQFPANFASYRLGGFNRDDTQTLNVGDTTLTISEVPFGSAINTEVSTKSRYPSLSSSYDTHGAEVPVWVGDSTGLLFNQVAYDPISHRLIKEYQTSYQGNHAIEILDAETSNQLAIAYSGFHNVPAISPLGKHVVCLDEDYLKVYDMNSLEVTLTVDLAEIIENLIRTFKATVSDEGDVFFAAYSGENTSSLDLYSFPITDPTQLTSTPILDGTQYPYTIKCSSDGQYIAHNTTIYSFDGQLFARVTDDFNVQDLIFDPLQERLVIWDYEGHVQVRELPSLNLQRSMNLSSNLHLPTIDPVSGKLGTRTWDDSKYKIIDMETGSFEREILVNTTAFILYNNLILSEDGYRMSALE